jgi:hypothetical protein
MLLLITTTAADATSQAQQLHHVAVGAGNRNRQALLACQVGGNRHEHVVCFVANRRPRHATPSRTACCGHRCVAVDAGTARDTRRTSAFLSNAMG